MYSQSDEEKIILENTPPNGIFLDIGALDGKTYSNTLALSERGWEGVCIEPNPSSFAKLQETYRDNSKIILINAILGGHHDLRKFYSNDQAVSTTDEKHRDRWRDDPNWKMKFNEIYSCVLPVWSLFEHFPGPYDFISIDTENTSVNIFKKLLQQISVVKHTSLICVEYDDKIDEVLNLGKLNGFSEIHRSGENTILMKA